MSGDTSMAVQFLRDLAEEHGDRRDRKRVQVEVLLAEADVHDFTHAKLLGEADRLEGLGKTTDPEAELLARLGDAEGLERLGDVLDLVWRREGVWVLYKVGEEVRTFASGVTASPFETNVPALAEAGKDTRAALLAILAVVEVTP